MQKDLFLAAWPCVAAWIQSYGRLVVRPAQLRARLARRLLCRIFVAWERRASEWLHDAMDVLLARRGAAPNALLAEQVVIVAQGAGVHARNLWIVPLVAWRTGSASEAAVGV
jgi:hypothetical protein